METKQLSQFQEVNGPQYKSKSSNTKSIIAAIILISVFLLILGLIISLKSHVNIANVKDDDISDTAAGPIFFDDIDIGNTKSNQNGCSDFPRTTKERDKDVNARTMAWPRNDECPDMGTSQCPQGYSEPPLILISMDGFRPEYLERGLTPTLQGLRDCGVTAPFMRPAYPTYTFPTLYTMITGHFPESHGIIDNSMYDMVYEEQFSTSLPSKFDGKWYGGDPLWLTVQDQGKKSAAIFWPGSDADIKGRYPDYCFNFDGSVSESARIDQVLEWLDMPEGERPNLITLYFQEPDSIGHGEGPYSEKMNETLTFMDSVIGSLLDGLVERELDRCANVIVTSAYGLSHVDCSQKVDLSRYLDTRDYYIYSGQKGRITSKYVWRSGGIVHVDNPEQVESILSRLHCENYVNFRDWYLKSYKKEEFPKRFHYSNNRRIEEVLVHVAEEWLMGLDGSSGSTCSGGNHGADNSFETMHSIFLAHGPSFRDKYVTNPFDSLELYNLMCDILDIPPSENNGTYGTLHDILRNPPDVPETPPGGDYENCPYPDEFVAAQRRNASDCKCDDWNDWTNKPVQEIDQQLNINADDKDVIVAHNFPHGVPQIDNGLDMCLLVQQDYINGFSEDNHMPGYVGFTVERGLQGSGDVMFATCSRADVRLQSSPSCNDLGNGISLTNLYPPGWSPDLEVQLDALIASNMVPMYEDFRRGIWQYWLELIEEYADRYNSVQVILGPVFDSNADGLLDDSLQIDRSRVKNTPIPSHYFAIVSYCEDSEICDGPLISMAVVFSHKPHLEDCWDRYPFQYLQDNVVRIRDVELLTGLKLFPSMSALDRAKLVTDMKGGLLDRNTWGKEEICPQMPTEPQCPPGYDTEHPPVLLISMDGMRSDYLHRNHTPTLTKLMECGTSAPFMISQYPTQTFPNHYSIITGTFPEVHGIVDNNMYDQDLRENFCISCGNGPEWWEAEPFWNTVLKNGKEAMTMFWPGSDVPIQDMRPSEYFRYQKQLPYEYRVSQVLSWLRGDTQSGNIPAFVTLYFDKVDSAGHEGGPYSVELQEALAKEEKAIKQLMDGLVEYGLDKCVNIIFLSDHGMSTFGCDEAVFFGDYLSQEAMSNTYAYSGTGGRLSNEYTLNSGDYVHIPPENRVSKEDILADIDCVSEEMQNFKKEDFPKRFHYARHNRIDPLLHKMSDQWQIQRYSPTCSYPGRHGYDPTYETMKATFFAYGPTFKTEAKVPPFLNTEIYNLLAYLTGVDPVSNNGTQGSLYNTLRDAPDPPPIDEVGQYLDAVYPDDEDYDDRADLDAVGCSCQTPDPDTSIRDYDDRLDLTTLEKATLETFHLPHGIPALTADVEVYILHQLRSVSGYRPDVKIALWCAFTLNQRLRSIKSKPDTVECSRPDVRLNREEQTFCEQPSSVVQVNIYPKWYGTNIDEAMDASTLTNVVPMYPEFYNGIWTSLLEYIDSLTENMGMFQVILGPIWDYDFDGRADLDLESLPSFAGQPIPSHYYAILLLCSEDTSCSSNDPVSFVLPHKSATYNCYTPMEYLHEHRTRVRDVELLTDLQFLTSSHSLSSINTRIHYPQTLW